ncbi:MAG: hypothetical protein KJZ78_17710 [Bryobacteraceae bacterium]|nr:hypothetical protein [Bryobacteraceae bacterium]
MFAIGRPLKPLLPHAPVLKCERLFRWHAGRTLLQWFDRHQLPFTATGYIVKAQLATAFVYERLSIGCPHGLDGLLRSGIARKSLDAHRLFRKRGRETNR